MIYTIFSIIHKIQYLKKPSKSYLTSLNQKSCALNNIFYLVSQRKKKFVVFNLAQALLNIQILNFFPSLIFSRNAHFCQLLTYKQCFHNSAKSSFSLLIIGDKRLNIHIVFFPHNSLREKARLACLELSPFHNYIVSPRKWCCKTIQYIFPFLIQPVKSMLDP